MTNEEKAREISCKSCRCFRDYKCTYHSVCEFDFEINDLVAMAEWKDQHPSKETIEIVLNAHTQVLKLKQLPTSKEEVVEGIYKIISNGN